MSSSNSNLPEKRGNFLDKVEKEPKPEESDYASGPCNNGTAKPKGTFLESSTPDQHKRVVERKAPSCGSRGG
jgi:hypothetical protein